MFKIKNKSMKPIYISGASLLPGEKMAVDDIFEVYVRLYEKMGYVQVEHMNEAAGEKEDKYQGHLDEAQLNEMSLADLKNLAEKMGVPSKGKNKAALAAALAAVEVETDASEEASEQAAQEQ